MADHHPAHQEDADHHDDGTKHPPTSAPHHRHHPAVARTRFSGFLSRARSWGERSNISWHLALARSLSAGPKRRSTAKTATNTTAMPIIFFTSSRLLDVVPTEVVDRREPPCTVWG